MLTNPPSRGLLCDCTTSPINRLQHSLVSSPYLKGKAAALVSADLTYTGGGGAGGGAELGIVLFVIAKFVKIVNLLKTHFMTGKWTNKVVDDVINCTTYTLCNYADNTTIWTCLLDAPQLAWCPVDGHLMIHQSGMISKIGPLLNYRQF